MGTMKMFPLVMTMSLPAMFSMLIQALYNVVDSIFVARYSPKALSAVSLAYPLQMIMISFCVGTAVGVNSLIARRLGAKNFKDANAAATHGLMLALINWAVFLVLGLCVSAPFLKIFTEDGLIIEYGTQYLSIVMCFSLGMMISGMCEKILQSTGNMIVPMLTQTLGAVVNIIFDPLLIFGLGPFPEMGVIGAAVATVFGQHCAMVFILIILYRKNHAIKIQIRGFRPKKQIIKDIYAVGVPAIVMQCIGSVMVSGINVIISMSKVAVSLAEAYINAFGVYFKLQSFVFMPVFGLNQGVMPIIGYNYGAKNKKRLYAAWRWGIIIAAVIMTLGFILFQLKPDWLLSLFGADEAMLEVGIPTLKTISLSFDIAAVGIMFSCLFQAVGKGFFSMVMSVMRQLVVLLPVAFILSKISLTAMWYAFPISEVISLLVAVVFFFVLKNKELKYME